MAKTGKSDEVQPIIVKKIKKSEGGHHGGAWKVAYADFVTAMMAFFLLLWLLNVSTNDQLQTISSYFDPTHPTVSSNTSGSGGVMGGTAISVEGSMTSTIQPITNPRPTGVSKQGESPRSKGESSFKKPTPKNMKKLEDALQKKEQENFENAKAQLEKKLKEDPGLAELAKNLMVDVTPEGLRIQLIDQDGKPMFPSGSAEMFDYTRKLVSVVAGAILKMPNDISIRGHTDSFQYSPGAKYTNWELSSDRANSSRRALLQDGVPMERLANVIGKADREHLIAENPKDPRNRRISIILLRETMEHAFERGAFGKDLPAIEESESITDQEAEDQAEDGEVNENGEPVTTQGGKPAGTFQRTPGKVYFP